ncbi:MAG: thiamine ABC transporter substrate-binding protein [Bdellovibrionales bacterium]|nr:thiamine ABC transporter substrate-binding protein [Bdellovibrionales bacterium]
MKWLFFWLAATIAAVSGCTRSGDIGPALVVLSYSSLGATGGFLPKVAERFKAHSGCALRLETTLGATQMVALLSDPKLRSSIDVVMGVDELLQERLKGEWVTDDFPWLKLGERLLPMLSERVRPGWIPIDFGALTFIYRKSALKGIAPPKSLKDLLSPGLRKKFILQDPRASSPGMLFFLFSQDFVRISELRSAWLALAPSWDSSYQMFLSGDAPMVWSYLSSLAYHASKGELSDYGAVFFEEGLPLQVEGMGIVRQDRDNPCVRKWIEFMMKPEVLAEIAEKQWMWPAFRDVRLPRFFDQVPQIGKSARFNLDVKSLDGLLSRFGKEIQGADR